jgi:hypothetical protein
MKAVGHAENARPPGDEFGDFTDRLVIKPIPLKYETL